MQKAAIEILCFRIFIKNDRKTFLISAMLKGKSAKQLNIKIILRQSNLSSTNTIPAYILRIFVPHVAFKRGSYIKKFHSIKVNDYVPIFGAVHNDTF